MNNQNFSVKNQSRRPVKSTMLDRAMHAPIKTRMAKISGIHTTTLGTSQIRINNNKSIKTNGISLNVSEHRKFSETTSSRRASRGASVRRNVINKKLNKKLSIGELKYETINYNTVTSTNGNKNTNLSSTKYINLPSSVKHNTNPFSKKIAPTVLSSTKASSHIKPSAYYRRTNKTGVNINVKNEGLDDKYLQSSLDRLNEDSDRMWEKGQERFENMTSDSMSSLESVPDEYTLFKKEPSESTISQRKLSNRHSRGIESNFHKPNIHEYLSSDKSNVSSRYKNEYKNENENENLETEIENKETQGSGLEPKYTLNVPSMISHLKRKDHYLESLDTFLNENLRAIQDLIKIKKEVTYDLKN
jgi:hypothetical protein